MFSSDDFGRGWRLPLLWVFGPLILGALLITGLGILARSTQGFPNIELAEDVRLAAGGGDPLLAEVTPFAWDRVCVFGPGATVDEVDAELGIDWGVIGGDPSGTGRNLLVFVRDGAVVTHFFLEPRIVPRTADAECHAPDDEATRL